MEKEISSRTCIVLGKENTDKLVNLHICVCGIGGVGSYVFESLVRLGIGKITVIDKDIVDVTNINRQLLALSTNIQKEKTACAIERAKDINPKITVIGITDCISVDNVDKYITKDMDYVVDAVDMVDAKLAIIKSCKEQSIPVISCMGMANRIDPLKIKIANIEKTTMCPLAKKMRKLLKEQNISKVKVVYSIEEPVSTKDTTLGSVPYVPGTAGLVIVSEIVKDIIKEG